MRIELDKNAIKPNPNPNPNPNPRAKLYGSGAEKIGKKTSFGKMSTML